MQRPECPDFDASTAAMRMRIRPLGAAPSGHPVKRLKIGPGAIIHNYRSNSGVPFAAGVAAIQASRKGATPKTPE